MEILSKLWYSAQVMVLGMLIVFAALAILIICIKALASLLSSDKKEAPKAAAPAPAPAPVVVPEPIAEAAAAQTGASADELIAVITAALMAYTGAEKSNKTLVVRNIRAAAAKSPAWARAGRADQLNSRF